MKYQCKIKLAPTKMIKLRTEIRTTGSATDIPIHQEKCIACSGSSEDIRNQHNSPLLKGARGISWLCEGATKKACNFLHSVNSNKLII